MGGQRQFPSVKLAISAYLLFCVDVHVYYSNGSRHCILSLDTHGWKGNRTLNRRIWFRSSRPTFRHEALVYLHPIIAAFLLGLPVGLEELSLGQATI